MVGAMLNANLFHHLLDAGFTLLDRNTVVQQGQFDIFGNRELVNQVKTLKNKSDVFFTDIG